MSWIWNRGARRTAHRHRPRRGQEVELKDGTRVFLRPIQHGDETRVYDLFANCSRATLFQRYHYTFRLTVEMAASLCQTDGDRELALVAELRSNRAPKIIGLCQLSFTPKNDSAEYAVLVTDEWQGKGLGTLMTHLGLELAKARGVKVVTGVTTPDNNRMTALFRKLGFSLEHDWANHVIWVRKEIHQDTGAGPLKKTA